MAKKNETKKRRRFIVSFIVIIILLLLIRSCSNEFHWAIGKLFGTSSEHEITDKSELPIVLNKNLKFDSKEAEISLNDKEYKIDKPEDAKSKFSEYLSEDVQEEEIVPDLPEY